MTFEIESLVQQYNNEYGELQIKYQSLIFSQLSLLVPVDTIVEVVGSTPEWDGGIPDVHSTQVFIQDKPFMNYDVERMLKHTCSTKHWDKMYGKLTEEQRNLIVVVFSLQDVLHRLLGTNWKLTLTKSGGVVEPYTQEY